MEIIIQTVSSVVSWYFFDASPFERWLIHHVPGFLWRIVEGVRRWRERRPNGAPLDQPSSTAAGSVACVGAGVVDQGGSPCCARCGDPLGDGGGVAAGDQMIGEAGVRVVREDLAGS